MKRRKKAREDVFLYVSCVSTSQCLHFQQQQKNLCITFLWPKVSYGSARNSALTHSELMKGMLSQINSVDIGDDTNIHHQIIYMKKDPSQQKRQPRPQQQQQRHQIYPKVNDDVIESR